MGILPEGWYIVFSPPKRIVFKPPCCRITCEVWRSFFTNIPKLGDFKHTCLAWYFSKFPPCILKSKDPNFFAKAEIEVETSEPEVLVNTTCFMTISASKPFPAILSFLSNYLHPLKPSFPRGNVNPCFQVLSW